jgi:soluble lytic murein transglycosylase-like protein
MKNGPSLVIIGTIIGSLLVGLVGWLLAKNIEIQPGVAVAYAASGSHDINQTPQDDGACLVSHKFPEGILQWCEIISSMADQADLPPNLVAAVILQESGGDATAYSASGAVGLMQVMPRDGIAASFECVNGPCFTNRPSIQELQDPQFNIEYGTNMLSGLIAKTGSPREALKAYGPMDVAYSYADKVLAIYDRYR